MSYTEFFLNNQGGAMMYECLEIHHSSFTQAFCYTSTDTDGVTASGKNYVYAQMSIDRNNVTNDLEQTLAITFADVDDELMDAINLIRESGSAFQRPQVFLSIYRDDDLTAPMLELQALEIVNINKDSTGLVTFDAQAPELNSVKTGQIYTLEDYPLLRGVV